MKIVDLSLPVEEGMMTFPTHWHPVVEVTILGRHGIEGRETRKIVLGTHIGTHADAPRHFIPNGATIDEIPLELLVGPATVVDFTGCRPLQEIAAPPDPAHRLVGIFWQHEVLQRISISIGESSALADGERRAPYRNGHT